MYVTDMHNLQWTLSAGGWTSGRWFGGHGDGVRCNSGPWTESEDGEAEELRGLCADCHNA